MERDNRLHEILVFITQEFKELNGVKYDWEYNELSHLTKKWFTKGTKHIARDLCKQLIADKIIEEKNDFEFKTINITTAREYRDNEKYKEKINILDSARNIAAVAAFILAFVVYVQDKRGSILTEDMQKLNEQNSKLLKKKDSLENLLERKDRDSIEMKKTLDALKLKFKGEN